jgi:hypothetical protein
MKKLLTVATATAMVFSSTVAAAATRPEPTRLSQPVDQVNGVDGEDDEFPVELVLLLLGGLLGVLAFAASGNGNSPR